MLRPDDSFEDAGISISHSFYILVEMIASMEWPGLSYDRWAEVRIRPRTGFEGRRYGLERRSNV